MPRKTGLFTLGHSPDPDDAFMFYAMAENKIDLRGYRFEHRLEDIQTLNERALRGELHISAISIHAFAYVSDRYALLPCGASMGDGYGPMVVTAGTEGPGADRLGRRNPRLATKPDDRDPGPDDERIPGVATLSRRVRSHRGPVRSDLRGGEERASRGGSDHSRGPAHLRASRDSTRSSIWANGGNARPVCPCPSVAMSCAKTSRLPCNAICWRSCARASISVWPIAMRRCSIRCLMRATWMPTLAGKFIGMYVNDYTRDYGETGRKAIREFLRDGAPSAAISKKRPALEFVGIRPGRARALGVCRLS